MIMNYKSHINSWNTLTTQTDEYLHIQMNADEYKSIYYYIYAWIRKNVHKKSLKSKKKFIKDTPRATKEEKKSCFATLLKSHFDMGVSCKFAAYFQSTFS